MKKFFTYFKGEKLIWVFFALVFVSTALNVTEPYFNGKLVDALTKQDYIKMGAFAIAIAAVAITFALMRYAVRRISVNLRTGVAKKLESDLCKKALNIKGRFLEEFKSGELSSITKENPTEMLEKLEKLVTSAFGAVSSVAVAFYVATLNIWCFLLYAIFFLVIFLYQKKSLDREKKCNDKRKEKGDIAKSLVNQMYQGISDIKVLNLKEAIYDKFMGILDDENESQEKKTKVRAGNRLFCNIAFQVYSFAFLLLGIFLMKMDQMTVEMFITIYLYRSYMYSLMFEVAEVRSEMTEIKTLAERINKILCLDETKLESFGSINGSMSEENEISFSNVSFSYGDGELLKDVSLNIKQGEVIGLVGGSGSAKTTLIKLLSRQLDANSGEILINGIKIDEYSEKGFTDMVSVASQHPFVFADSIRENLLMVKKNATEAEMWKALEKAKILGFVKSLENGLDSVLTESTNMSGGQVQRIALARLFLKNTPIIILDEATSALDNRTQAQITNVINAEAKEHIFIVIAHRIEAVKDADRILFLEKGVIADEGKHKELMKRNQHYADLVASEK